MQQDTGYNDSVVILTRGNSLIVKVVSGIANVVFSKRVIGKASKGSAVGIDDSQMERFPNLAVGEHQLIKNTEGGEIYINTIRVSTNTSTQVKIFVDNEEYVIVPEISLNSAESLLVEYQNYKIISNTALRPSVNVVVNTGGGSGNSVISQIELGEAIGGGSVVYVSGGLAYKYNQSNSALYGLAFGVTNAAGISGDTVDIVTSGKCTAMGGLISGSMYYALDNGLVSNTPPISGTFQPLGIAENATDLIVNLEKPYIRT